MSRAPPPPNDSLYSPCTVCNFPQPRYSPPKPACSPIPDHLVWGVAGGLGCLDLAAWGLLVLIPSLLFSFAVELLADYKQQAVRVTQVKGEVRHRGQEAGL